MKALRCLALAAAMLAAPASHAATPPSPTAAAAPKPAAGQIPAPGPMSLLDELGGKGEEGTNGEWAEYALLENGKPLLTETLRVQTGTDPVDGGPWLEVWLDKTGSKAFRVREGFPPLLKNGAAIIELPQEKAPETCSSGTCQPPTAEDLDEARANLEKLKPFRYKVVAGTFNCQKIVRGSGENQVQAWKSDEVPGIKLVRALYPGGRGFELVAYGKNGRSAFPEKFKAAAFPFANLKNLERLLPSNPNGTASLDAAAADAAAPQPEPAPVPELQPFDPSRAKKP